MRSALRHATVFALLGALVALGCDSPSTTVTFEDDYPAPSGLVVWRAEWQSVWFDQALLPGQAADPQPALPASPNSAYVVLAPGWDPQSSAPPTSFVVLLSQNGFDQHLNDALHIPVDDAHFFGNCAAGSHLSQEQADFITQQIFRADFVGLHYDAATCTTTTVGD